MEKVFQKKRNKLHGNSRLPLRLAVLGATGSVGRAILSVKRAFPEMLDIVALVGGKNVKSMLELIKEFSPKRVGMVFEDAAEELEKVLGIRVYAGEKEALVKIWQDFNDVDSVVVCVVGIAGFLPTYEALKFGKKVFLSTKEALVVGGEFIMRERKSCDQLIPLDSEHWAIFSCMEPEKDVARIYLPATGGALRYFSHEDRRRASAVDVLNHPVWKMGRRITVDSSTLMNKGFEVIEAHYLFSVEPEKIKVVIHREAWVHGIVEFVDGSFKAFISYPDMRLIVQEALLYPRCLRNPELPYLKFDDICLCFSKPDFEEYPCLNYAYYAVEAGGNIPVILNAADEVAVSLFLSKKIRFNDIYKIIRKALFHFPREELSSPDDIYFWDAETRRFLREVLE